MKRILVGLLGLTIACTTLVLFAPKSVARGDSTDAVVVIDETTFPDDNFRQFVLDYIDTDRNQELSLQEINYTTSINVKSKNIDTLKGIAYFTELTELIADYNNVISLDLYANTKLKNLSVQGNELALLNVTKCTQLETLKVGKNELTDLNLRYCTKLTSLDCRDNSLTQLNLSYNVELVDLICADNKITDLSDVNNLTGLKNLNCKSNMLKTLYIDGCPELLTLDCSKNALSLLDVTECTKLTTLTCSENVLTSLDLNGCRMLQSLYCKSNKITTLDLTGCYALQYVHCEENDITSLDVSERKNLNVLQCNNNELAFLDVSDCPNVKEITAFQNKIETFDCSNCPNLGTLKVQVNQLTSLDLSGMTELYRCECGSNKLTSLDVSGCTDLHVLYVNANELVSLDLSDATELTSLDVGGNRLTSLDLSKNLKIDNLDCCANCLTSLDLSGHAALEVVECMNNQLTELNVDNCTALYRLRTYKNNLAGIDLSACDVLREMVVNGTRESGMLPDSYVYSYYIDSSSFQSHYICFDNETVLFTEKPMKVAFDANGGSGSMPKALVPKGDSYVLPESAFAAPAGYEFAGWDAGLPGDTIVVSSDLTVKATWKAINYTVTVSSDGNGSASASVSAAIAGTTVTLNATPNAGYQFKEWQVIAGGVTIADPTSATTTFVMGAANVEIKAVFEAVQVNPDPTNPQPGKEPSFEDFIERMYVVALNRASEPEGKAFWMDKVKNEGFTGGRVAIGFLIEAPEFLNRNLSDSDFVDVLYKTFFDREADEGGKAFWMGHLATDMTREQVVRGFIDSTEWCNLCAYYGVKSGAPNAKAEKPSNNALKFATRLYTECLGREPDADGLLFWALRLTNLESSGYEAAKGFFESKEFTNKNVDDETYVKLLYRTFMGRDYDQGGLEFWLGHLSTDMNRLQVLQGFAQSQEFTNICNSYGIERGEI